jgi:hypothetical protein
MATAAKRSGATGQRLRLAQVVVAAVAVVAAAEAQGRDRAVRHGATGEYLPHRAAHKRVLLRQQAEEVVAAQVGEPRPHAV